jgi:eukaryotic-like serine/threonine-protein kinase
MLDQPRPISIVVTGSRNATSYELRTPPQFQYSTLYPAYVRGLIYLKTRQGLQAAAECQNILNHRGAIVNFYTYPLAQLGLSRAYALQGDTARAGTKYQDFLTLWKDADPDIPILKEAKTEYAKLQ